MSIILGWLQAWNGLRSPLGGWPPGRPPGLALAVDFAVSHGVSALALGVGLGTVVLLLMVARFAQEPHRGTGRRRVPDAPRLSLAELQAIYDGMVDGVLIADVETRRFRHANPAMCRMLGYTEAELLGKSVTDIHPPDRLEEVQARFAAMAKGSTNHTVDVPCLRKDGTVFLADIGARIAVVGGQRRAIGVFRDGAARREAEAALRDSEANLRAILNSTMESALLVDTEGRILAANEEMARRFGRRVEEVVGSCGYDLLPPQLAASRAAQVAEVIRCRQPVRFEDERNGRYFDHHVYPVLDGQGRVARLAVFTRDVTEEKRHYEALRASEERFRAMAAAAPLPIVIARESDGGILYANARLEELLGVPSAEVPTRRTLEFYADAEDRTRLRALLNEQGHLENYAVRARKADGTEFWIEVSVQPMTYAGQPALIAGISDIDTRKRAEETLRRQALVLESLYDAVLVTDLDNRITDCNSGAERLFGYAKAELLGRSPEILDRPEDAAALTQAIQAKLRSGERWEGELRVVCKDGTKRVCDTVVVPILDAAGLRVGAVSVDRDITARKEAERAVLREQRTAQRYLDTVPALVVVINVDQTVALINPAGCQLLGFQAEAVLGKNWFDHFLPARIREAIRYGFQQLATGKTESFAYAENPVLTRGGEERLIAWNNAVLRNEAGAVTATLSCGQDITERKRAEAALRESETKFRTVAETLEAAIVICRGPQIIFANPATLRMSGYTLEELCARPFWEFVVPEHRALARAQGLAQQVPGAVPTRFEVRTLTQGGEERWMDFSAAPFVLEGQPVALLTALDVTARRRAEAASRRYQAELAQVARLSTMGQLAAQLSHELNQPLTAIHNYAKGGVQGLRAGDTSPAEVTELLEKIAGLATRAGRIIHHTRDLVSRKGPHRAIVDVNEVIREVSELAQYQAHAAHVRLELALADSLPHVFADRVQLGQIVLNLLSNAVDALRAVEVQQRHVTVTTQPTADGGIEVTVCDTGPGLAPAMLDEVFKAYVTTRADGMGMGLAICRSIVDEHGGRIWATPNPERGITFRFTLPGPAVRSYGVEAAPAK